MRRGGDAENRSDSGPNAHTYGAQPATPQGETRFRRETQAGGGQAGEIMSSHAGLVCQASMAPEGAECAYGHCRAPAEVRLVLRDGDQGHDYCEIDWPRVTHALKARGQTPTDTTGDIWTIRAEFPNWDVWHVQVSGVYYALTSFGGEGVSVHAYLVGALRAGMLAAERARAGTAACRA